MQGAGGFPEGFVEPMQIAMAVFVGKKTRLAVMSTLHDVQRHTVKVHAGTTRHGCG
jgi:hypothetical protein